MLYFRPLFAPTIWFLPALALLIGLGVWQVQRLHWKEDVIQRVQARMHAPAVPLDVALARGLDDAEWRRVTVRGHFLYDREVHIFATGPRGEAGVQVVVPFALANDGVILVNRGFTPNVRRNPATRAAGQVKGEVTVTGVVRLSQAPNWFTPQPEAKTRLWFSRTAESMAAAMGVTLTAPIFVEADATPNPGGYPMGGQTVVDFPNNHLSYAITWFALALALTGVYLVYHARQGRLRFEK
jgi:surfeit locus 1 family protein